MGTRPVALQDVRQGPAPSRLRLLAPLNYLRIWHPEKTRYDFLIPGVATAALWLAYTAMEPKPALFGDGGLLRFTRDLLVMTVPFLVGALAAVALGAPSGYLDRRTVGAELVLHGEILTLRQFVCHLLGYLCFLGLVTLAGAVFAELLKPVLVAWTDQHKELRAPIRSIGAFALLAMLSALSVTVLWALYFLTDIINRKPEVPTP